MNSRMTLIRITCSLSLVLAGPVLARTEPNAHGRFVGAVTSSPAVLHVGPGVLGNGAGPGLAAGVSAAPLALNAVGLDSTWYDLQDMGSLGTRVVVAADGRIHVAYLKDFCELDPVSGCPPDLSRANPYPQRAMAYAHRSPSGLWTRVGKVEDPTVRNCCITEVFGGFGGLAVTPGGRAVVSQHMNEDGCDLRGAAYWQRSVGGATWMAQLAPITEPSYLFPQVVAPIDGSLILCGEIPLTGAYSEVQEFRLSRLAAPGAPFVCPVGWQFGNWASVASAGLFKGGTPGFPALATASNGRVGVAVGDFGGNVHLIESSDGTFAPATVTTRNLTHYLDAEIIDGTRSSTTYRPYVHCHLAYNDTTPHVVWSELQARRIGGAVEYFDYRSRIRHWTPARGVSTVRQTAAGEADTYVLVDEGGSGPLPGFNTISVDWPQVGFSVDGQEAYVAWLRFVDAEVDPTADAGLPGIVTGIGYGDIACSVSRGGGDWSTPQNLTQTPATDERFFSLAARNAGGLAHLVYQSAATTEAGVVTIGDRGTTPGNILRRIAYLERPLLAASAVEEHAVPPVTGLLRVWPNPSSGSVRIDRTGPVTPGDARSVDILDVSGRLVVRLSAAADGTGAEWDGRLPGGGPAPAGLYFTVWSLEGLRASTRFVVTR